MNNPVSVLPKEAFDNLVDRETSLRDLSTLLTQGRGAADGSQGTINLYCIPDKVFAVTLGLIPICRSL
jgi:hypothetical protein